MLMRRVLVSLMLGITVIPLEDNLDNKMVYVRRKGINLSSCALKFVNVMFDYFDTYKP